MTEVGVNLNVGELAHLVDVLGRHVRHTGCARTRRIRARLVAVQSAPMRDNPPARRDASTSSTAHEKAPEVETPGAVAEQAS